jgi:hypothetical protein
MKEEDGSYLDVNGSSTAVFQTGVHISQLNRKMEVT